MRWDHFRPRQAAMRAAMSGLMTVLCLAAFAVASSGWLHHCVHEDSPNPQHLCAVKVLAQSAADCPPAETAPPVPSTDEAPGLIAGLRLPPPPAYVLLPGRAPPVGV